MKLILTSDSSPTSDDRFIAQIRTGTTRPRIAWILDRTDTDRAAFDAAQARFSALGFDHLELVDIDEDRDDVQIAYLHEFDVVYLTGTDAVRFRFNAMRAGLMGRLRQCAVAGRVIIGVNAGALLLTPNVSLARLDHEPVSDVLATRARFEALGAVPYEVFPQLQLRDATFLERVREYSSSIENDVVGLADGGAIFTTPTGAFESVGTTARYRKGTIIEP